MKSKKSFFEALLTASTVMASVFLAASAYAVPLAYIANNGDDTVTVINTKTQAIEGQPIAVGDAPDGIVVSPDGTKVYVSSALTNEISVIDTVSAATLDPIDIGVGSIDLAITPDGSKLYIARSGFGGFRILKLADNTVSSLNGLTISTNSVAVSPDGSLAYLTGVLDDVNNNIAAVDVTTDSLIDEFGIGASAGGIAFSPTESKAYVTQPFDGKLSIVNTSNNNVTGPIDMVGNGPSNVAFSLDGSKAYVTVFSGDNVAVIDAATNTFLKSIPVGQSPLDIAITPDGSKLYVSNSASNNISIIDIDTETVDTVDVGTSPNGITFANVIRCGDGIQEGSEQCDDGNTDNGDNCSSLCKLESEPVVCGDGKVEGTEECDDGNGFNDDECSNACTVVKVKAGGDGCSLSPLASVSALSFLPLAMAPLVVALRRFMKKA